MFTQPNWLTRIALVAAACGAIVLTPVSSSAGTLQVKDNQSLLSSTDVAALRSEAEGLPFDVRVVTTEDHAEKSGLERYVREQLTAPNMVVVGLDKAHRHTAVHFGTGTGVPPTAFKNIEQAGNASFREGNWRGGIAAILSQTRSAARPSAAQAQTAAPARASTGASTAAWGLVVVLVVAGLIVFVGVTLARRARTGMLGGDANANALQPGAGFAPPAGPPGPGGYPPGAYPPGGYPPGGYPPGGYPPGGYPPGYQQPPGFGAGGGMGRNIAAAGLGGLVGYQLGKMADNHGAAGAPEQAAAIGSYGQQGSDAANVDAGGSAGSWDEDASNAGSDWDSGGGGGDDFGGGDGGGGDW